MLLVTNFNNEAKKYYYAGDGHMNEAMLAILKIGWNKFFSKWSREVDPMNMRPSFVEEHWDMATMDDDLFEKLPVSMQKMAEGHRKRYRIGMERMEHKVEILNAAQALVNMEKEEALDMTTVSNGKNRALVAVVAEELNKLLNDNSNDGYTSFGLYEVVRTEKI